MKRHTALARTLLASAAFVCAVALAGCDTDGGSSIVPARAMKPLSPELQELVAQKNMPKESPILIRIFKEEAELEVWKQDASGQYAHLKTFPICRWSGELGPKIKEGDRQAPEGFYAITPGLMNPNSSYYLAFNLGFPNAYDKANDRTGAFLMVHGDCSSRGCYAMTDEQISDIYALGRDSFLAGQKSFQVQAYPFRMTPLNMAKHRNSPHMAFWRMLKQGYDHFEVTRQEPKIDVCDKKYVFDATASAPFSPRGKCPAYSVPEEVTAAVSLRRDQEDKEFASYVAKNVPMAPIRTGTDGGMHPTFLAKLRPQQQFDNEGRAIQIAGQNTPPLPATVNPPRQAEGPALASTASVPARPATRVAAGEQGNSRGGLFNSMFSSDDKPAAAKKEGALDKVGSTMSKWLGLRKDEDRPPPPPKTAEPAKPVRAAAHGAIRPPAPVKPNTQPAEQKAAFAPAAAPAPQAGFAPAPQPGNGTISGAQPAMPSGSFESRWGGLR